MLFFLDTEGLGCRVWVFSACFVVQSCLLRPSSGQLRGVVLCNIKRQARCAAYR